MNPPAPPGLAVCASKDRYALGAFKPVLESKYHAANIIGCRTCQTDQDQAAAPTGAAWPVRSLEIEVSDWDTLFDAVLTRLRLTVDAWQDATLKAPSPSVLMQARLTVLQCAADMDLLHTALTQERRLSGQMHG
jgi:hypothetical protein